MKKMMSLTDQLKQGVKEMRDVKAGRRKFNTFRTYQLKEFSKTYTPAAIKKIRKKMGISQRILSVGLGTSVKTVQSWEAGIKFPSPTACRLLDAIENVPNMREYVFPGLSLT